MNDRYLDPEQKFYNYRTSEIDGNQIFDINKASNSWAQNFIDDPKYMRDVENSEMQIVHMSPQEYWEICARDVFNKPIKQLMDQWRTLDGKTLEHLTQVILKYKKRFPITYINYASHNHPTQEGLHRMIVAGDLFGWDTKFPVMLIKWADEEKAAQEKENKRKNEVENNISKAIDKALRYRYYKIDELKDQLYAEIEAQLKYDDEFEGRSFKLDLVDSGDKTNPGLLTIVDNKYECFIAYEEIQLQEPSIADELDDEDDWLFETYGISRIFPNVHTFLTSDALHNDLIMNFGNDYSKSDLHKEICNYIKDRCPECDIVYLGVSVWRDAEADFAPLMESGYAVIKYRDKLYDFTSHQFDALGLKANDMQPRVLSYNERLSNKLRTDIYSDGDYIISI